MASNSPFVPLECDESDVSITTIQRGKFVQEMLKNITTLTYRFIIVTNKHGWYMRSVTVVK